MELEIEEQQSLIESQIATYEDLLNEAGGAENLSEKWQKIHKEESLEREAFNKARGQDDKLLSDFLPNLQFTRDSTKRLLVTHTRKPLFSELRELNDAPQSVRGEIIRNAKGWRELRPTRDQRIYYRRSPDNRAYEVLIGDKNSQSKDMKWMKTN